MGMAGLMLAGCTTLDSPDEVEDYAPLDGQALRTDGMQEHLSEARAAKGRLFMAENKLKPGVITRPSGLQYIVLEEGDGATPTLNDSVVTHYFVSTVGGRELDNSADYGGAQEFRVDKVIAGWREALQAMKVGARWKLYVPAELAYGERGLAQIPGGETLVYDLELMGVNPGEVAETAVVAVAEDVPAPPSDLDLSEPAVDTPPSFDAGQTISGLEGVEPGTRVQRGGVPFDNLDLLD